MPCNHDYVTSFGSPSAKEYMRHEILPSTLLYPQRALLLVLLIAKIIFKSLVQPRGQTVVSSRHFMDSSDPNLHVPSLSPPNLTHLQSAGLQTLWTHFSVSSLFYFTKYLVFLCVFDILLHLYQSVRGMKCTKIITLGTTVHTNIPNNEITKCLK